MTFGMTDKMQTGSLGENLAAEFLERKGFRVVCRNFRWKQGEIDLIVQRENWMIFVEVKTRRANDFGEPESFISAVQRRMIYSTAEEYVFRNNWQGHVRFDVVSVRPGAVPDIVHFEDAIYF